MASCTRCIRFGKKYSGIAGAILEDFRISFCSFDWLSNFKCLFVSKVLLCQKMSLNCIMVHSTNKSISNHFVEPVTITAVLGSFLKAATYEAIDSPGALILELNWNLVTMTDGLGS